MDKQEILTGMLMKVKNLGFRVVIMMFCFSYAQAETSGYTFGYFLLPPHVVGVNEEIPHGAAIDYFNEHVFPKMKFFPRWFPTETPLARVFREIEEGKRFQFLPFLLKRPAREKYLHYSEKPYFYSQPAILVAETFPLQTIQSIDDLKPYTVGFFAKGAKPKEMLEAKINFHDIAGKRTHDRLAKMLESGRIHAVFDYIGLTLEYLRMQSKVKTKVLTLPVGKVSNYFVASKATVPIQVFEEIESLVQKAPPYSAFALEWLQSNAK